MPQILSDFLLFIKDPQVNIAGARLSFANFFTLLLVTVALVIPYGYIMDWVGIGQFDHVVEDFFLDHKFETLISAIVFAPLLEEMIFRYHLTLKAKAIGWSLVLSLLMISQMWWITLGFLLYLLVLFVLVLDKKRPPLYVVVYVSTFFFGMVHLGNYSNFDFFLNFYWIPFLVGVQFAAGLLLSFIRLRFGLARAVYFHATYNGVLIIPAVLFGVE